MAKKRRSAGTVRASKSGLPIRYNSLTFILFLSFVLLVSIILVANMLGSY